MRAPELNSMSAACPPMARTRLTVVMVSLSANYWLLATGGLSHLPSGALAVADVGGPRGDDLVAPQRPKAVAVPVQPALDLHNVFGDGIAHQVEVHGHGRVEHREAVPREELHGARVALRIDAGPEVIGR